MDAAVWVSLGLGVPSLVVAIVALVYSRRSANASKTSADNSGTSASASEVSAKAAAESAALAYRADRRVSERGTARWRLYSHESNMACRLVNQGPDDAHDVRVFFRFKLDRHAWEEPFDWGTAYDVGGVARREGIDRPYVGPYGKMPATPIDARFRVEWTYRYGTPDSFESETLPVPDLQTWFGGEEAPAVPVTKS